jgi:hypothetical protein
LFGSKRLLIARVIGVVNQLKNNSIISGSCSYGVIQKAIKGLKRHMERFHVKNLEVSALHISKNVKILIS